MWEQQNEKRNPKAGKKGVGTKVYRLLAMLENELGLDAMELT